MWERRGKEAQRKGKKIPNSLNVVFRSMDPGPRVQAHPGDALDAHF